MEISTLVIIILGAIAAIEAVRSRVGKNIDKRHKDIVYPLSECKKNISYAIDFIKQSHIQQILDNKTDFLSSDEKRERHKINENKINDLIFEIKKCQNYFRDELDFGFSKDFLNKKHILCICEEIDSHMSSILNLFRTRSLNELVDFTEHPYMVGRIDPNKKTPGFTDEKIEYKEPSRIREPFSYCMSFNKRMNYTMEKKEIYKETIDFINSLCFESNHPVRFWRKICNMAKNVFNEIKTILWQDYIDINIRIPNKFKKAVLDFCDRIPKIKKQK
jgi:hypothetical protein